MKADSSSSTYLLESQGSEKIRSPNYRHAILPFIFPVLGGVLYGYDIGATSSAAVSIESANTSGVTWYDMTPIETGLLESGSLYGAVIGSIFALNVADILGRKRELIVASLFYILGSILMASAPSFITLVAGRFVYGFGIGMAVHGGPLYIAETCPTNIRGMLVSMKEGGIVLGMLLGYVCGYLAMDVVGGWRIMYSIGGPIACIMCLGMCWLPRSPRWILLHAYKGNASVETSYEDAKVVIQRLLGKDAREDDVYCQLEDIVRSLEYFGNEITIREVFKGPSLRALIVGIGLVLFQQFTGQPSVLYYSTEIVQTAGFAETSDAAKVSIVIGVFKLIMTLLAVWRVDKIGRRPLLIGGIGILTCSLFVLAAYYAFIPQTSAVALIALFLYVGAYQVSFGPMGWLLLAEIFPLRTRAWASSFCLLINFSANAIVTFIFPILQVKIGTAAMFTIFGVIGAVGILFVALRLPETKGLSLEEIEAKFSD